MELINRRLKVYGPPPAGYQELRHRLCPGQPLEPPPVACEQEFNIMASYGPSQWVRKHHCEVRGVPVQKLAIREGEHHVWCLFPDGRTMIVAERNIKVRSLNESASKQ
jgi:hypothetical protein